ncbi:uncharacterized protein KIAA2013 homolog [Athalia rosae]|uniref:uncharacterized protein KIAA2013 homolog n=1 Tax=Athalia rosae TaxID=37344 RepID=UPI0020335FA8|nr:uncharacterized protein KIAA2013 homolog [Athalia rosae]
MRGGGMFDAHEFAKRMRRLMDNNYSYRKLLALLIVCGGLLLYLGPFVAQWLFSGSQQPIEAFEDQCINERLAMSFFETAEYNANIMRDSSTFEDQSYLAYVGNGVFGIPITADACLYIKHGRTLSLKVPWQPIIAHSIPEGSLYREATVTYFTTGIVQRYQCFREGYYLEFQYYAHRGLDGILVQDIKLVNPSASSHEVPLKSQASGRWSDSRSETVQIQVEGLPSYEYTLTSGYVPLPDSDKMVAVAVVYRTPPKTVQVQPRSSTRLEFLSSIYYGEPVSSESLLAERQSAQRKAMEAMKKALVRQQHGLKDEHIMLWQSYWQAGLRISDSKAKGAINGHKINSTMYYVLSQIPSSVPDVEKNLANNEGCYRGHHTLDAPRLWQDTSTIEGVNEIAAAWLVTLEKQGCHHLMVGGPAAVQQAIVLSLGSLRFSNQHLEFNIDPQYLHRDYLFRRISYGNVTHLNVSVHVGEDNRAVLGVALDRSDSVYYGCDAGCLDAPVPLSQAYTRFPVKVTRPLTAILYITSDQRHMQDLRNALHVHEVDEAPAHDHHVMALHKHGHRLGGLPTFFWVSICFLIVVFHMFLFKLIISEYCDHQDRQRTRYGKP